MFIPITFASNLVNRFFNKEIKENKDSDLIFLYQRIEKKEDVEEKEPRYNICCYKQEMGFPVYESDLKEILASLKKNKKNVQVINATGLEKDF